MGQRCRTTLGHIQFHKKRGSELIWITLSNLR